MGGEVVGCEADDDEGTRIIHDGQMGTTDAVHHQVIDQMDVDEEEFVVNFKGEFHGGNRLSDQR